jgi:hypothetical protein
MTTDNLDEMTTDELGEALREVASDSPRTEGWLTGKQIEENRLMATDDDESRAISLRISDELLDRIESVQGEFDTLATSPSGEVSRSEAMRRLMLLGLERLEGDDDAE